MSEKLAALKPVDVALEDHGIEGIEILTTQPPRLYEWTVWLLAALLLAVFLWSFFGRVPETVTVYGRVVPASEVRRFYAPIEGELVDIYVSEGQPVAKGDVLARLNARGAVDAAARALDAQIRLDEAAREARFFPERKALLERKARALAQQIEIEQGQHDKRIAEGLGRLQQAQRAKLEEARSNLEKARRSLDVARAEKEKFERLLGTVGEGGISRAQVEEKRSAFLVAQANVQVAEARLGELDFLLSKESSEARAGLETSDQKLTELKIEYESLLDQIRHEQNKVELNLRSAQLAAEAASRVSFDNIDAENFLRVVAPESGVITEITFTQPGDKITANTPLGGIAPADARAVLQVEIPEAQRGLLAVGLPVKLKFSAFPYERFGFIEGQLEYLSPTTQLSDAKKDYVFKGRVSLERDHFVIDGKEYKLRYGMTAQAEIVVRERRVIDLVLDPLRKVGG